VEAEAPIADEVDEAPFEEAPALPAEPSPAGEAAEDEGPKKKKTRRGSRGGRGRTKKKGAATDAEGEADASAAAPAPVAKTSSRTTPPATPVVRTGSTDRHLISDEPVLPPPVSRPRTYRDLDHIPDDLD
jgi:hypothetical protein